MLFSCEDLEAIGHEPESVRIVPARPGVYSIEMQKGQTVFIYPEGQKPSSYEINFIEGKESDYNAWGKH